MQRQYILSWAHLLDASTWLIPYSVPPSQRHPAGRLPHMSTTMVNSSSSMHWANAMGFREILTRSIPAHSSPNLSTKLYSALCYTFNSSVILPFFLHTSPHPHRNSSSFPFFLLTCLSYLTWLICLFVSSLGQSVYDQTLYIRQGIWGKEFLNMASMCRNHLFYIYFLIYSSQNFTTIIITHIFVHWAQKN